MRVSLNWLKDFVDVKKSMEEIHDALSMIGFEVNSAIEMEGDYVMDIEVTANRPDCLSIFGVARELSAAIDAPLKIPDAIKKYYMKKGDGHGGAKISIIDKKSCLRYVGCALKNVRVAPSPEWLIARLNAVGIRAINNIADITNYVLFETGQPLHAFDFDKLAGGRIIVRKAKKGETIVTIDGETRELDPEMLIIADAKNPVAIAGIMGGKDTEISEGTKNVLLESAYFDPMTVRKTQRKLGLASESSYRFERGVDFYMALCASMRAQELIKDLAGGRKLGAVTDVGGKILQNREVSLTIREIYRVLGIDLAPSQVIDFLSKLGLKASKKAKDNIIVKIPFFRQDLETGVDIIEEIARVYGYDKIPVKMPKFTVQKTYEQEQKNTSDLVKKAKNILYCLGMNEIVTYTLTSRYSLEALGCSFDSAVRLQNPLSSNQEFMRPSLLSEMMEALSWNINRKNKLIRLFELNRVYSEDKKTKEVKECLNICIGLSGVIEATWKNPARELDFFDLKGIVEFLLKGLGIEKYVIEKTESPVFKDAICTSIKVDGELIGIMGEAKPETARKFDIKQKTVLSEIYLDKLLKAVCLNNKVTALPKYPSINRDLSLIADDNVQSGSIVGIVEREGKGLIKSVKLFDLYKGLQIEKGKKGIGYTIEYRSDETTLKDGDITPIHQKIQGVLVKELGIQIR